jgi:hypothetical protein
MSVLQANEAVHITYMYLSYTLYAAFLQKIFLKALFLEKTNPKSAEFFRIYR